MLHVTVSTCHLQWSKKSLGKKMHSKLHEICYMLQARPAACSRLKSLWKRKSIVSCTRYVTCCNLDLQLAVSKTSLGKEIHCKLHKICYMSQSRPATCSGPKSLWKRKSIVSCTRYVHVAISTCHLQWSKKSLEKEIHCKLHEICYMLQSRPATCSGPKSI